MKIFHFISVLSLSSIVLSCTRTEISETDIWQNGEIVLKSENTLPQTGKDNEIFVWADIHTETGSGTEPYFNAWRLVQNGDGSYSSSTRQFFPSDESLLNIYAMHGNFKEGKPSEGESLFPEQIVHHVETAQEQTGNYSRSDLLYASGIQASSKTGTVYFKFHHLLAKMSVRLIPGEGVTAEELKSAEICIKRVKTAAVFSPEKLTLQQMEDRENRARMVAADPESGTEDISVHVAVLESNDTAASVYGEAVVIPQTVDGNLIEVSLPVGMVLYHPVENLTIESGNEYAYDITVNAGDLSAELTVKEWQSGDDITVSPDWDSPITINWNESKLQEGSAIDEAKTNLSIPHYREDNAVLAIDCGQEIEIAPDKEIPGIIEITPTEGQRNKFTISKCQMPPGYPEQTVKIYFRRKGLAETYPDDFITVRLLANTSEISGRIQFDPETDMCDFGNWVEGEMGILTVPEGKTVTFTQDSGQDAWMKAEMKKDTENTYRLLAGWRPNDPKADGREQTITLTIADADGDHAEHYKIKRRNWGLPVVKVNGTWWSKYNLRGNSKEFADQITSASDTIPAENLYKHLQSCSETELLELLGDHYQGNVPQGLKLAHNGTAFYFKGMKSSVKDWGQVTDEELLPEGWRLPHYEDYRVFAGSNNFNLKGEGTHTYNNIVGKQFTVSIKERDVNFLNHHYNIIDFYEFKINGDEEPIVLCGLGTQWNTTPGNMEKMWILFATVGTVGKTWLMEGYAKTHKPNENWMKYTNHNGTKTRVLRVIKKPVEYIY